MIQKTISFLLALLLSLSLLTGCGSDQPSTFADETKIASATVPSQETKETTSPDLSKADIPNETKSAEAATESITVDDPIETNVPEPLVPAVSQTTWNGSNIPEYDGAAYTVVNGNRPYFAAEEITPQSYEYYAPLDHLGRCGTAVASIGRDLIPTEKRGSIGMVKPSGWHTVKYDCVDGKYLYNRCHLIGYQLSGENANVSNLITGTRYLNIEGMLPFENMVADYVQETGNHVMYRVTPVFEGDNLLSRGVLMEGLSVEDAGDGICFAVFAHNAQPGVSIDYATGDSRIAKGSNDIPAETTNQDPTKPAEKPTESPQISEPTEPPAAETEPASSGQEYILNTNTKKFHYPHCSSADRIKDSNRETFVGSREYLIAQGYDPCKRCNP